ncbi:hypothetical protein [Vallicoccus soli]|uniref:Zf-HC2 domain-containing protein n=1 Tax=Vallicoccus soli TaxID=2339232 RepID=A0A3A3YRZ5_9ACTN|nr:hypothetical protein [Vallicoccus soli]RJK94160.1 hypothetical protein D5H78_14175 [Vallicoccus soli]
MSGGYGTPGAGSPVPWPGHLDAAALDALDDRPADGAGGDGGGGDGGGGDGDRHAELGRRHVAGCPACAALLDDLRGVRALLAALPGPGPVPDDVAARLRTALAAEGAPGRPGAGPAGAGTTGAGTTGTGTTGTGTGTGADELAAARARRRPRRARTLLGAAAAVAAAAVVAVPVAGSLGGHGAEDGASSAAGGGAVEAAPAGPLVVASGRDWGADDLAGAAAAADPGAPAARGPAADGDPEALDGQDAPAGAAPGPAAQGTGPSALSAPGGGASALDRLRDPAALDRCVAALRAQDLPAGPLAGDPVRVDLARYDGRPAAVLVLPVDDPTAWVVVAVGPGCGERGADVLGAVGAPR